MCRHRWSAYLFILKTDAGSEVYISRCIKCSSAKLIEKVEVTSRANEQHYGY